VPPGPPGEAAIAISPQQGYIDTLINVAGRDWWPGEPVFVFLRVPSETDGRGYAYAAAVADDDGNMRAAFTFPNEMRWVGESWAEVVARGSRSGLEATARFDLMLPTAGPTSPPPTPLPTRLPGNTAAPGETVTPTGTASAEATATPTAEVVITDWLGEYYANMTLSGESVFIRNDVAVDFNWGAEPPDPRLPADQFSARWTRQVQFPGGFYRFTVSADDGVRLWIDGQLVVDEWQDGLVADHTVDVSLAAGPHAIRLEYYENLGGAMVRLGWDQAPPPTASPTLTPSATPTFTPTPPPTNTVTPEVTPTHTPTEEPTPTETSQPPPPSSQALPDRWAAEYFANPLLQGPPVLTREDPAVDFDWGAGSPGNPVPPDDFSARWQGQQSLQAGSYLYSMAADDGARLYVDGNLILDGWAGSGGKLYHRRITLEEGVHTFQVEYYETSVDASVVLFGEALP
jgi:hypothetical protein